MEKMILDGDVIELGTVTAETRGNADIGFYDSETSRAYVLGGIQDDD